MKHSMNFFQRKYLELTNPLAYKHYKFLKYAQQTPTPLLDFSGKTDLHFKHSGNSGDVIYAMPAMLAIAKEASIHLHLQINRPGSYGKSYHPLGTVMLNEKMVSMLQPLILSQHRFCTCDILHSQQVQVDLDKFREYPLMLDRGNIARWYFLTHAVNYDLSKPWLQITPNHTVQNAIVIARSHRHNAPGIDYSFLKKYPRLVFLGIDEEYKLIKKTIPNIDYYPVKDFLEMAAVIAGSRLFIGNQSFPFSLAEALKVNRLLEVYFKSPNVSVEGCNGFDFCFQPQFEKLVKERYEQNV